MRYIYVNQPSSISKRELPFLGPDRTGEGGRGPRGTKKNSDWLKTASRKMSVLHTLNLTPALESRLWNYLAATTFSLKDELEKR